MCAGCYEQRSKQMSHRQELKNGHWQRLRKVILERDAYSCWMCGKLATTVDHLRPVSAGGTDDETNLAAACLHCNSVKHDRWSDTPVMTINW